MANPLLSLFGKIAPRLTALSSKTIDPAMTKIVGTGVGAIGGGVAGASYADEGNKTRGFMVGALTGGLAGRYGGKIYAGMGAGGADAKRIAGFADELKRISGTQQTTEQSLRDVGRYISRNWSTPEHMKPIPVERLAQGPANRAAFGFKKDMPVQQLAPLEGSSATRAVGKVTRNIMGVLDKEYATELGFKGKNIGSRLIEATGREMNEAMHYTKDGFRYRRSVAGKVVGGVLGSGAGIGAFEGVTATNPDGSPAPLHKKILKGSTSALGWGLATPFMATKAIAHDIPKMIIKPEG